MDPQTREKILRIRPHPLKAELRKRKINQYEAACFLGVSQPAVSLFLNGLGRQNYEQQLRKLIRKVKEEYRCQERTHQQTQ